MSDTSMFKVVPAADLQPERDVYMGLPVENTNKQTFHRIPIRSSCTESETGDRRICVKLVPGQQNVVLSCQELRRLLIKFPVVFVPGIKVFEASNDNDRTNLSMGFALYDSRVGPSPEETQPESHGCGIPNRSDGQSGCVGHVPAATAGVLRSCSTGAEIGW